MASEAVRILNELIASCERQITAGYGDLKRVRAQLEAYRKQKEGLEKK